MTLDDPVSTRVTHWCAVGYDNGTVEVLTSSHYVDLHLVLIYIYIF